MFILLFVFTIYIYADSKQYEQMPFFKLLLKYNQMDATLQKSYLFHL